MHDVVLSNLEAEADRRWMAVLEICEQFGFACHEPPPEVEHDPDWGYYLRIKLSLSDEEEDNLLDESDRIKLLLKALVKHEEQYINTNPYGVFVSKLGANGRHRHVYLGSAAGFEEHLWDMYRALPKGKTGMVRLGWNETLHRPAHQELDEGKVSRKIIFPDGTELDDGWRHDIRLEFTKLFHEFGCRRKDSRKFSKWTLDIADFGGRFEFDVDSNELLKPEDRANLMVKAVARKLVELIDRGYFVTPASRLHDGYDKEHPISVEHMVKELDPRIEHRNNPKTPIVLDMHWAVHSPKHTIKPGVRYAD